MADLNSWEDDPAAQDDNLSRQTQQQLNVDPQNPASAQSTFRPGIASFQPGAQSFQPGQPYGGYMSQYPQQQYYQQGQYPQYGGQQGFNQYSQGYGAPFGQGYGQGYGTRNSLFRPSNMTDKRSQELAIPSMGSNRLPTPALSHQHNSLPPKPRRRLRLRTSPRPQMPPPHRPAGQSQSRNKRAAQRC